jgi:hypothetical protein
MNENRLRFRKTVIANWQLQNANFKLNDEKIATTGRGLTR